MVTSSTTKKASTNKKVGNEKEATTSPDQTAEHNDDTTTAAPAAVQRHDDDNDNDDEEDRGLISLKRPRRMLRRKKQYQQQLYHDDDVAQRRGGPPTTSTSRRRRRRRHHEYDDDDDNSDRRLNNDWMRPYWLGVGLFLALFSFWILDTLKDPIFGALVVANGGFDKHQPTAKLFSVCLTLALVCFFEYVSNERQRRRQIEEEATSSNDNDILDGGGQWTKMKIGSTAAGAGATTNGATNFYNGKGSDDNRRHFDYTVDYDYDEDESSDRVSSSIFVTIGVPYCVGFGIMAYLLQFNPAVALVVPRVDEDDATTTGLGGTATNSSSNSSSSSSSFWHVLGYFLYGAIESFGSIVVASYWSFVNSSLNLHDAERYYGTIIAIAQIGAIAGSTIVTTHVWNNM